MKIYTTGIDGYRNYANDIYLVFARDRKDAANLLRKTIGFGFAPLCPSIKPINTRDLRVYGQAFRVITLRTNDDTIDLVLKPRPIADRRKNLTKVVIEDLIGTIQGNQFVHIAEDYADYTRVIDAINKHHKP